MNIYIHTEPGQYIGSCVVVIAPSLEEAETIIRDQLNAGGLDREPLDIVEYKTTETKVIHFDNGDY